MSSKNKKIKEKRSNSDHGFALKEKLMKLKRMLFFNSAIRQHLKRELRKEVEGNTEG